MIDTNKIFALKLSTNTLNAVIIKVITMLLCMVLMYFFFCCNLFSSGKFTAPGIMKGATCHQKATVAPWCGWYFLPAIFRGAYKANCFYHLFLDIAAQFQEVRPFSNPAAPCGR